MSDRILLIVDNLPRGRFFTRFVSAARQQGTSVRFLAYRLSSYRFLKRSGFDTVLLRQPKGDAVLHSIGARFHLACQRSLEVASGDTELETAIRKAPVLAAQVEAAIEKFSPTHLFLWNGSQLIERLAACICPPEVVKRYFEIANLPGKIFVDSMGVNAESCLYQRPESLLVSPVPDDDEFDQWRSDYFRQQINRGVPQAKAALALQWERPADALASRFGYGFYPIGCRTMLSRFLGKLTNNAAVAAMVDECCAPNATTAAYRFFPLQVSGDTQLLFNSSSGNLQALQYAFEQCQNDGIDLVVKIHPAENNRAALRQLRSVLRECRSRGTVYLSNQPTTSLIQNAEKVYTINSTVGLEALIAGKPLEVLGRAFYQHFVGRPDLLKCYLLRYLIPFDYFGSEDASPELLMRILVGWPTPTLCPRETLAGRS